MRWLFAFVLCAAGFAAAAQEKKDKDLPPIPTIDLKRKDPVEYSRDVEPIFANKCFVCHTGNVTEGKFDMSTHAGVLKGGKRGPAVVPGKSAESNLFLFCSRQKKPVGKAAKAAHISLVESIAFSPDGKTLATGSFQELTLWDVETGEPKQRIGGFADRVTAIAYSPDGKLFATGGGAPTEDGEIKVFDAEAGTLRYDIKNGHSDTVFAVAFHPSGLVLATAGA